ncbi:MAG TPA: hypothetical protein VNX88_14320 [Terriglobales bacterium]|jgi:hypothetical protein|nr:hypothetical protein [Terriglobales bacterium]
MAERKILNSWKEIANYVGRGVRTVQRWEAHLGLPVHRPSGRDHSAVLAFSTELDQWLDSRPVRQAMSSGVEPLATVGTAAAEMQELISRAEILLKQLESVLSRSEEMHRRLSGTMDALANGQLERDLRGDKILQGTRADAA